MKTKYMATIYNGHSHIERRVYEEANGERYIKVNGLKVTLIEAHKIYVSVDVWYSPEPIRE